MSTLKVIKNRMKSVENTKKITETMKAVSIAKFTRAEKLLKAIRPFGYGPQNFFDSIEIDTSPTTSKPGLVVAMSSDRGLCGGIHSGVARAAGRILDDKTQSVNHEMKLICVGEKNRTILSRVFPEKLLWVVTDIGRKPPTFVDASLIAQIISNAIEEHVSLRTQFCFNKFINAGAHRAASTNIYSRSMIYSSPKYPLYDMIHDEVMKSWLEFSMAAVIFWMLNEGVVSELSARMSSMEGAAKNAGEMIKNLTLEFNRTRQAVITKELTEIISGASAT